MDGNEPLEFAVRQRLNLERILTAGIGLLMCAAAVLFAAPGRTADQRASAVLQVQTAVRSGQVSKVP